MGGRPRTVGGVNRRVITLLVALAPVIAFGVLLGLVTVPYVSLGPGPTFNTLGKVEDKEVVDIQGGDVHITFTLTTPGCPIGPQVTEQMEEFVGELDGVDEVECEMVFVPPWSPERMSEDAKFALGF